MSQGLLFPESPQMLRWLLECGQLLVTMGKPVEARSVFEGAEAIGADSEVPTVCLGDSYLAEGGWDEAAAVYQRALESWPHSSLAKTHLAQALYFGGRADEARRHLDELIDSTPETGVAELARSIRQAIDEDQSGGGDQK